MKTDILIGGSDKQVTLNLKFANRHGLIAGATGTGKTVTVQVLAESFSKAGVPVMMVDVKGDMSGISQPGKSHPKVTERLDFIGLTEFEFEGCPVRFWDVFAKKGLPLRVSISEMGPQLLSRLLDLNETQESILALAFEFADEQGLLMLDMDDLQTTLRYLADHSAELKTEYGTLSKASINAIFRRLLLLKREGAKQYFGEPALELSDLMRTNADGHGIVNILDGQSLIQSPRTYTAFLMWLMSEFFENLPEVGNPDKPEMVLFFDEAHLLFKGAPRVFLEKVEQVVRLIRSKGVGLFFISQSPSDIPDSVLSQLGNRVQHALRAYTPKERKTVRVAAQSFRQNPKLDTEQVITELGVGEALVSVLQAKGVPSIVQRTLIRPPHSKIGPAPQTKCKEIIAADPLLPKYKAPFDPKSAHEELQARTAKRLEKLEKQEQQAAEKRRKSETATSRRSRSRRQGAGEAFFKSVVRSVGSSLGRKLARGILGSLMGGR